MAIKYEQNGEKIEIKFDKVLKDLFKQNFKTAQWDSWNICWKINNNTRNLNKLKKWIKTVENSNVLDELKKVDELEFTKEEIEKLEQDLRTWKLRILAVKENIKKTMAQNESKKKLIEKLESKKAELKKYEDLHNKEQSEKMNLNDKANDIIEKYIDIETVYNAKKVMTTLRNRAARSFLRSSDKARYNAAQAEIYSEHRKLMKTGFYSKGIYELTLMNCNRPDRDDPGAITEDDIYNLEETKD